MTDVLPINDRDWFSWEGVNRIKRTMRDQAQKEGLEGLELHFRAEALFQKALDQKPTYRERQRAWLARVAHSQDPFREALEQIAAGHNDPRQLAIETLNGSKR